MPESSILKSVKDLSKSEVLKDGKFKEILKKLPLKQQKELALLLGKKRNEGIDFIDLVDEKENLLSNLYQIRAEKNIYFLAFYLTFCFNLISALIFFINSVFFGGKEILPFFSNFFETKFLIGLSNLAVSNLFINSQLLFFLFFFVTLSIFKKRDKKKKIGFLEQQISKFFTPCAKGQGITIKSEEVLKVLRSSHPKLTNLDVRTLGRELKKLGFVKQNIKDKGGRIIHLKRRKKWRFLK